MMSRRLVTRFREKFMNEGSGRASRFDSSTSNFESRVALILLILLSVI